MFLRTKFSAKRLEDVRIHAFEVTVDCLSLININTSHEGNRCTERKRLYFALHQPTCVVLRIKSDQDSFNTILLLSVSIEKYTQTNHCNKEK